MLLEILLLLFHGLPHINLVEQVALVRVIYLGQMEFSTLGSVLHQHCFSGLFF